MILRSCNKSKYFTANLFFSLLLIYNFFMNNVKFNIVNIILSKNINNDNL